MEENIIEYDSPILGKYKKGNMWDFQIIFYPLDFTSESGQSLTYKFNAYRHITMAEILNNFQKFIKNQQLVLKIIFGEDIFNIIKKYLPSLSPCIEMIVDNEKIDDIKLIDETIEFLYQIYRN